MEVNCAFSVVDSNKYYCNIENISITSPETRIVAIKGQHEIGQSNKDVIDVCIAHSTIEHFPRNLGKLFPNMVHLSIENCGLKTISRKDLKGLGNLEVLRLNRNDLIFLPNDLFRDMKKLHSIYFDGNKLKVLSSKLLDPIKGRLKHAIISVKAGAFFFNDKPEQNFNEMAKNIDKNFDSPIEEDQPEKKQKNEFLSGVEGLWMTKCFSDFTIITGSKRFPIHKYILGTQSSAFAAIFQNNMKERIEGKMKIEEFSENAVEEFLRFFYTFNIQNDQNAMELFALADKYDVPNLKTITEEMILKKVNKKNALDILNLGNLHKSEDLKEAAFEEIQKILPQIELPEELKENPEGMKEVIREMRNCKRKLQEIEENHDREIRQFKKKKDEINEGYELV